MISRLTSKIAAVISWHSFVGPLMRPSNGWDKLFITYACTLNVRRFFSTKKTTCGDISCLVAVRIKDSRGMVSTRCVLNVGCSHLGELRDSVRHGLEKRFAAPANARVNSFFVHSTVSDGSSALQHGEIWQGSSSKSTPYQTIRSSGEEKLAPPSLITQFTRAQGHGSCFSACSYGLVLARAG
jgi:hypothetical protein